MAREAKNVALYVHIPFCLKKCDYCDFFSIACASSTGSKSVVPDSYIDSLLNEADFLKKKFKTESFSTIYIGGGTPSLLTPAQIERLISSLKEKSALSPKEITIEANPQDITEDFLDAVKNGVGDMEKMRLSVGFQSFSDDALKAVGRRTTRADNFSSLSLIERKWGAKGGKVSADLISGLPFETRETFFEGLEILTSKNFINHISLYSLCVEEETLLHKKIEEGKIPYNSDEADELWILARDFLEGRGFFQYEVSNFSKKGFESRHNMAYWKQEPYFGLGSGGCSTVKDVRFTGTRDIEKFVEVWKNSSTSVGAWDDPLKNAEDVFEIEKLDDKTREFEFLMMGFRTLGGVSCDEYKNRFNKDLVERLNENGGLLEKWISDGRAACDFGAAASFNAKGNSGAEGLTVRLTKKGILFLNEFLLEL